MATLEASRQSAVAKVRRIEILLVEDNPIDAEMTIRTLRQHDCLNPLLWVKDGQEALDFLFCVGAHADRKGVEPPKLILLDIRMPKVNGIELLQKIKTDARLSLVPVVVLSSSSEHPDIAEACRLGVNSYIVKSIDFGAFGESIAKAAKRYIPTTAPNPIRFNQHSHLANNEVSPQL